MLYINYYEY